MKVIMKFIKSIVDRIRNSTNDHLGKASSTRISSYIILSVICSNVLVFMVIDVVNAAIMWNKGETYTVPSESIWIFGLLLSHHLGLLFHKKKEFSGTNTFVAKSNLEEVKQNSPISNEVEDEYNDENEEG